MGNPFDQFDAQQANGTAAPASSTQEEANPFDRFDAAPQSPAQTGVTGFLKRQLGGQGEQPYGSGLGYLIDNPVTRGLGGAANELATGASELVQRGVGVVSPTAAAWLKRNVTQPLAERQSDFEAPKTAGIGSDITQAVSNLGGQLAFAGLAAGPGAVAEAPEAATGIAKLATYLRPSALRAAGSLGFGNAAAQAAQQEAQTGTPESTAKLLGTGAAMTAGNLIPLGGKGGVLTRAVKGAVASEGINEGLNLVNGQPLGTGALMATGLGAGFGLLPHAPKVAHPEPFPGAAPGTLSDAANTLHRNGVPPAKPQAGSVEGSGAAEQPKTEPPITVRTPPPPAPWINPETGETHTPSAEDIVAAIHGLLDSKAAAEQAGTAIPMYAPRDVAEQWGLPLERVKSLMKVAGNERRNGMTTEQAIQRGQQATPEAEAAETAMAPEPAQNAQTADLPLGDTTPPLGSQPDLLSQNPNLTPRQRARIAQRIRGGGVAPGVLEAAADEATAAARAEPTAEPERTSNASSGQISDEDIRAADQARQDAEAQRQRAENQAAVDTRAGWAKRAIDWFQSASDGDTIRDNETGQTYRVIEKERRDGSKIKTLSAVDENGNPLPDGRSATGISSKNGELQSVSGGALDKDTGVALPETTGYSIAADLGKGLEAGTHSTTETPPQGGVSASATTKEETDHAQQQPAGPARGGSVAAAGEGERAPEGAGAAAAETAGSERGAQGAAGAGRHEGVAVPAEVGEGGATPASETAKPASEEPASNGEAAPAAAGEPATPSEPGSEPAVREEAANPSGTSKAPETDNGAKATPQAVEAQGTGAEQKGSPHESILHRETDADGANELLEGAPRHAGPALNTMHAATSPELALGQGHNRGVHVELASAGFDVERARQKPGAAFAEQNGAGSEVLITPRTGGTSGEYVRSVTLKPGWRSREPQGIALRLIRTLKRRVAQSGWTRTETPDGVVYRAPIKEEERHQVSVQSVDAAALESAAHPENPRPEPTPAQHEAGNFQMGHVRLHGMDVSIEVPKGGLRRGTNAKGKPWERAASDHYGYIRRTEGADGEQVDTYLGPHAADASKPVFIVDQVKPGTSTFDEHKVMLGYNTGRDARASYDANFPKGVKTFGGIRKMSLDEFKDWLKNGDLSKPVATETAHATGTVGVEPVRGVREAAPVRAAGEGKAGVAAATAKETRVAGKKPPRAASEAPKEGDTVRITKGAFKGQVGELRGVAGPNLRNVVVKEGRKAGVHSIHVSAIEKAEPEAAPPAEPTTAAVEHSAEEVAKSPTVTMTQARKDLLAKVDNAITEARKTQDFSGEKDSSKAADLEWSIANGAGPVSSSEIHAARLRHKNVPFDDLPAMVRQDRRAEARLKIADRHGYITFDVPGDGKFKVINFGPRLLEFKRQIERQFKTPKTEQKASTQKNAEKSPPVARDGKAQRAQETADSAARAEPKAVRVGSFSKADTDRVFHRQLDAFLAGDRDPRAPLTVGATSPVYKMLGADSTGMVMPTSVVRKALGKHGLDADTLRQIPDAMDRPVMVFKSATTEGALVALTRVEDKGRPVVVAIHVNREPGGALKVNNLASIHAKDSTAFVQSWLDKGLLRYLDQKQSPEWLKKFGLQLPETPTVRGSGERILTEEDARKWADEHGQVFSRGEAGGFRKGNADLPTGGIDRAQLDGIVRESTAKWGADQPRVRVVDTPEQLPDEARADPGYRAAEGYISRDGRTVYLVRSKLGTPERARQVLAHEAIGHYGVDRVVDTAFGAGAWQKVEDNLVRLDREGLGSDAMKAVLAETHRRYPDADPRTFAKEAIAVMAEKGVRNGILDRVVAAVRKFLRQIMPNLKINEAEFRQLLVRSDRLLRTGENYRDRVARVQAMAFDRQADPFYSALTESVANAKGAPKSADAAAWKQWLDGAQRRGEFKGSEREWLGLDQWLDQHKGPITRADINDFVRENQVRVQEVMHRDEIPIKEAAGIHENEDGTFELVDHEGAVGESTKYGTYQLPGGENYRELLLTLPDTHAARRADLKRQIDELTNRRVGASAAEDERLLDKIKPLYDELNHGATGFRSGHFDEPNILAHVRMNDRTGPDGERILHVEEIQSDWHQQGRKKGYSTPDLEKPVVVFNAKTGENVARFKDVNEAQAYIASRDPKVETLDYNDTTATGGIEPDRVPDAPFKKEWPMLAMKRVLRYAAEHGYDKVTWTTGQQQAARYDLSKRIGILNVAKLSDGDYAVHAYGPGGADIPGFRSGRRVPESRLADMVGKELAEKIIKGEGGTLDPRSGARSYSGLDLRVGGEGMSGFYDKLLPNEVNKYVKQWGAKVGETSIGTDLTKQEAAERIYGSGTKYEDLPAASRRQVDNVVAKHSVTTHSLDITPAMRESVMKGQPLFSRASTEPQATMDNLDEVMKARATGDENLLKRGKAWLGSTVGGKFEDLRPKWLGALQTRHVLELAHDLPILKGHADEYGRSMQQLDADRNHLMVGAPLEAGEKPKNMLERGAVPVAQALREWAYEKGPSGWLGRQKPEAKRLFDLMHQATIWGLDPDKAYERLTIENAHGDAIPWTKEAISARLKVLREQALSMGGDPAMLERIRDEKKYLRNLPKMERTREQRFPELVRQWQALSDEAKQHYRDVRDWYSAHRDATEEALVHNIEQMDLPETYRRSLVNRMRLQFEEARRAGVYFPLNRDGDYWIAFQDKDGNEGFKMAETFKDAQAAEKKLRAGGFQINSTGRRDPNMKAKDAPSGTFVRGMIDILKKAGVSEKVQDQVYQSFLQALPEMSMRKHSIHRRNIAGFSEDALRAFAKNSFHGAHQLAKLRHAQDMQISLEAMQQSVDAFRKGTDELGENPSGATLADTAKADALVGELAKRHQWTMNPNDTQLANMANSIGFVYYLGASPASALTNLTQVVQTVLPVLGAQHGWPKAMRMLGAAWRDAARTGGHLDRTLTDPDERRAFLVMQQRGDFSKTQAHTLAGLAEGNVLQTSPVWSRTMNAISWMFHTAEVINREATGMAAFRLARASGKDFNEAIQHAGDINAGTNFDYSAANRPRLMQNNTARIALQFKQYSIGMSWLFYRNLYQAMKGETPEVRRLARRTVTGILGMTALLAGTTGLPIYNGVKMTGNLANLAFGDPDEPFDFDTEFHNWLADHVGTEAANVIATGPVSELTGANLARRTSLSNLWFQDADRNLEGADAYHALLESLAGPLGGITKNMYVGAQRIREGNVQRGIETMLPTAVKNSVKALRFAHDGANTLRGDPILPDVSGAQDFIQALGFEPTKLAEQQRINSALANFTQEVQDRRQMLLNAYAMALHSGSPDDRSAVLDKMRAFNQQYPTIAVTPKSIRASLKARARYSARAVNGIAISPKLLPQAREFAGADEGSTP